MRHRCRKRRHCCCKHRTLTWQVLDEEIPPSVLLTKPWKEALLSRLEPFLDLVSKLDGAYVETLTQEGTTSREVSLTFEWNGGLSLSSELRTALLRPEMVLLHENGPVVQLCPDSVQIRAWSHVTFRASLREVA